MFCNISNIGPHRSKQIRSFHMTDSLAFSQFYGFHWVARDFKLLTELVRSFISFKCMKQNLFLPAFLWQADKNQVQYKTDEKMQQTKNWEKNYLKSGYSKFVTLHELSAYAKKSHMQKLRIKKPLCLYYRPIFRKCVQFRVCM